jgi:hypothetical protein
MIRVTVRESRVGARCMRRTRQRKDRPMPLTMERLPLPALWCWQRPARCAAAGLLADGAMYRPLAKWCRLDIGCYCLK